MPTFSLSIPFITVSLLSAAFGCFGTPTSQTAPENRPVVTLATDLALGGCAPLRYQPITRPSRDEPHHRGPRVSRSPPAPMPFRVHSLQGSSLKALSKSITDELRGGKRSIVSCVDSAIPDDGALVMRLTVLLRGNKRNIVNLYGITAPKPRACAIRVAKELINNLNPPRTQRHMIFTITVGPRASESPKTNRTRTPPNRGRQKTFGGAQSGLALGSAIETEHTTLAKMSNRREGRWAWNRGSQLLGSPTTKWLGLKRSSTIRRCANGVTDTLTDMSIKHDANVEPATYQCAMGVLATTARSDQT